MICFHLSNDYCASDHLVCCIHRHGPTSGIRAFGSITITVLTVLGISKLNQIILIVKQVVFYFSRSKQSSLIWFSGFIVFLRKYLDLRHKPNIPTALDCTRTLPTLFLIENQCFRLFFIKISGKYLENILKISDLSFLLTQSWTR